MEEIKIKVPGKLFLLGEYAVVDGGYALILPVKKYITVIIKSSNENEVKNKDLVLQNAAIDIANEYLDALNIQRKSYSIEIQNELIDEDTNKKLGLGSSAAIVVGVIKAILRFHSVNIDEIELFKLSALSYLRVHKFGSLADIATVISERPIIYRTFNKEFVLNLIDSKLNVLQILEKDWPNLFIKKINIPESLHVIIGWTKEEASTPSLLKDYAIFKKNNEYFIQDFIKQSNECLSLFEKGIDNNLQECKEAIIQFRNLLKAIQENSGIEIETESIKEAIRIGNQYNIAIKSSGAGNGDCFIGVYIDDEQVNNFINNCSEDIKILNLEIIKD